jgi:hypothetical protein
VWGGDGVETTQRITGWIPGSAEHSVIRVVDEGIELEGVVLGGPIEEPFAVRYAVVAEPDGRCRGVTARTIGSPILVELYADGKGGWTDDDGVVLRELEGAIDVDLGVTPVTHALVIRRLGIAVGESADVSVAAIDVLGGEIRMDARHYVRLGEERYRVEDTETGEAAELRYSESDWTIEVLPTPVEAVS